MPNNDDDIEYQWRGIDYFWGWLGFGLCLCLAGYGLKALLR